MYTLKDRCAIHQTDLFPVPCKGFVDACIIGGPPSDGYDPAFYASAAPEDADTLRDFVGLSAWGLRTIALEGEGAGVGDASALKMSYAVSACYSGSKKGGRQGFVAPGE